MENKSKEIELILEEYKNGYSSLDDAMARLAETPFEDISYAKIDHSRMRRQGYPEVVYCPGKTDIQIAEICLRLIEGGAPGVLASRAGKASFDAVKAVLPDAAYHETARMIEITRAPLARPDGYIAVVCAGTADLPVAEEAAVTAEAMGNNVKRIYDVGVAGIHRLFARLDDLRGAGVIIAVAGMEGALASVVGGLADMPVIAVPTSVGYGASFGGLSALLCMLNSCAAGVGVVNIDNGFGAAVLASKINRAGMMKGNLYGR